LPHHRLWPTLSAPRVAEFVVAGAPAVQPERIGASKRA
jgi:hypothetical protein